MPEKYQAYEGFAEVVSSQHHVSNALLILVLSNDNAEPNAIAAELEYQNGFANVARALG